MLKKRLLIATIITINSLLNLRAQGALSYWVTADDAAQGQQILLRRTFASETAGSTHLLMAATGSFNLYINGRIAYSSFLFPCGETDCGGMPNTRDIDVSAYIMPGENVIAVWLAPGNRPVKGQEDNGKALFSADLYVRDEGGDVTFCRGDASWLWTEANSISLADGEAIDGRADMSGWYSTETYDIVRWRPAEQAPATWTPMSSVWEEDSRGDYTRGTIRPRYHSRQDNGKSIVYDFGKGFYGLFRVTFRNARKGERVYMNGSKYICSGRTDEQFIGRFVASGCRKLHIEGDSSFSADHVSAVEGVIISSEMP